MVQDADRYDFSCQGKVKFASKKEALTVVNRRGKAHNGAKLRAYPHHNHWHVTSQVHERMSDRFR